MENSTTVTPEEQGDGFNKILAVLIAVVTLLIAVITFLQSDAGNRDDMANRDTKSYSLEAFGKQVSGDARVNYDYNSAYQAYYELDLLAASAAAVEDTPPPRVMKCCATASLNSARCFPRNISMSRPANERQQVRSRCLPG
jgi:hypothetical protein